MDPQKPVPPKPRSGMTHRDTAGGLADLAIEKGLLRPDQAKEIQATPKPGDSEAARMRFAESVLEHGYMTVAQLGELIRDLRQRIAPCIGCGKDLDVKGCAPGTTVLCDGCGQIVVVPVPAETPAPAVTPVPGAEKPRLISNRYEIICELGHGGMGIVYQAIDRSLRRTVALKLLRSDLAHDATAIGRFESEARAAARLKHPNIVPVHDLGISENGFFIAMDYISRGSFRDRMARREPLKSLVRLLSKVARAVMYAHSQGVVHRDLKPENILVDGDGEPYVTDFGLAKVAGSDVSITRDGLQIGTPLYMSPEQVRGDMKAIDGRSDVYALGAMLYEILTGRPPFLGATVQAIYTQILEAEPARPRSVSPAAPADLELVALKAIDKEAHARYADAGSFADELDRWIAGEPVVTRPASTFRRIARRVRRNWIPVAAAVLILGVAGGSAILIHDEKARRDEAERAQAKTDSANREAERYYELAREEFTRIGANPALTHPQITSGYRSARENLDKAIAILESDRYLVLRSRVQLGERRLMQAEADGTRAIALAPNSPDGYLVRAEARTARLDSNLAGEVLLQEGDRTVARPVRPLTEEHRVMLQQIESDMDLAVRKMGRQPTPVVKGRLIFLEGYRLSLQQEWVAALPKFEEASRLDPNNPVLWHRLAISHQVAGTIVEGMAAAGRASDLAPGNCQFAAHRFEMSENLLRSREARGENVIESRKKLLKSIGDYIERHNLIDGSLLSQKASIVVSLARDLESPSFLPEMKAMAELLRRFLVLQEEPLLLRTLGDLLLITGMLVEDVDEKQALFLEARKALSRSLELCSESSMVTPMVRGTLAEVEFRTGILLEATGNGRAYLREAIEHAEYCTGRIDNWHVLEILGFAHIYLAQRGEEAAIHLPATVRVFTRLLEGPAVYRATAYGRRAEAHERMDHLDEALRDLEAMKKESTGDGKIIDTWIERVRRKMAR